MNGFSLLDNFKQYINLDIYGWAALGNKAWN